MMAGNGFNEFPLKILEVQHHIRSRRLLIRRLRVEDVNDDYVRWMNDPETTKYLEVRFSKLTRQDIEKYVRCNLSNHSSTWHLGVFDRSGDRLVGTVTFNHIDYHHRSAAISFVIGYPDTRGRGYATEAVHAATFHMFHDAGFIKLWGGYYADHAASARVFRKNGYRIEGRLKGKLVNYRGERVDHVYVGLLREKFLPNKEFLEAG
ncbi:MAG: GNAT family N-acetyltransferase [Deltaproteobacteria bacterium]|nr:GNAT family N-acetyltransferase [Deltaproteobacteria bacterium]